MELEYTVPAALSAETLGNAGWGAETLGDAGWGAETNDATSWFDECLWKTFLWDDYEDDIDEISPS